MEIRNIIYVSRDGTERGYEKGVESLRKLIKTWNYQVDLIEVEADDINALQDIQDNYKQGAKIVTCGKGINNMILDLSTDMLMENFDGKGLSTTFQDQYLNKKRIKAKLNEFDFEVLPMFHPLYVLENKRAMGEQGYIEKIRSYFNMTPKENERKPLVAKSYKDLYDYIVPKITMWNKAEKLRIAYDIESNYLFNLLEGFEIVGFSLAVEGQHGEGIYTLLDAIDGGMSTEDKNKCFSLLKWVLSHPKVQIVVHNMMYELPATLNVLGYEIPRDKIDDTLVWSKLFNSGKTGGNSLKAQAVVRLGYSDWSRDLDDFTKAKIELAKFMCKKARDKVTYKNKNLPNIKILQEPFCQTMMDITYKYYDIGVPEIIEKFIDKFKAQGDDYNYMSYSEFSKNLVAKYGAIDAIATMDLLNYYENKAREVGPQFDIDLFKGYKIWIESHYGGYKLELNSVRWDEKQARSDEIDYLTKMKEDLIYLLLADKPLMRDYVRDKLYGKAVNEFFQDKKNIEKYIEQSIKFKGYTATGKIRYITEEGKIKNINPNNTTNLVKIFEVTPNVIDVFVKIRVEEFLQDKIYQCSLEEIHDILNPNSIQGKEVLCKLLYSDYVGLGKFIFDMSVTVTLENFKTELANKKFNQGELELVEIIKQFDVKLSPKEKYDLSERVAKKLDEITLGPTMSNYISIAGEWRPETLDEENMVALHSYYASTGLDVDDDWNTESEFTYLARTRRYKKINKMWTTYINGRSLGRSQVYVVDKKALQRGDKLVPRKRLWDCKKISDDEELLFQVKFKPNSVMSGRWSSGVHTIPSFATAKRYLASRYKGGTVIISDFSQAN